MMKVKSRPQTQKYGSENYSGKKIRWRKPYEFESRPEYWREVRQKRNLRLVVKEIFNVKWELGSG